MGFASILSSVPPLYRVVPEPGVHFDGHFLPAGTEVCMSQWAIARNLQVWGSDIDVFRQERWTEDRDPTSVTPRRQGGASSGTAS
jgi:cytochrome P450